jgi:hypothetical protein
MIRQIIDHSLESPMQEPPLTPQSDFEKFHAAYKTWKQATDEYDQRILAIIELESKHRLFMESSKPFVRWK